MITGFSKLLTLDRYLFHLAGEAAEKPTGKHEGKQIANGSTYIETDTGTSCVYNESKNEWVTVKSGGGGGGPKDLDGDGVEDAVAKQDEIDDITDAIWKDDAADSNG